MRIVLAIAALVLCAAPESATAEPRYGICRTQLDADVEKRFKQKITTIDYTWMTDKSGRGGDRTSQALIYTDGCPGYHVYELFATEYDCESRAHYGTPPNMIRYRVSAGGC